MRQVLRGTKRVLSIATVAMVGAGVSACGEHPLYANEAGLAMELTPENPVLTAIGQTRELTLTARDLLGRSARPRILVWETTNPEVATVDQYGRVTAVRDGIVGITVRAGDAGYAATRVYVEATVKSNAWISAVANRDRMLENNRDSTSVVVRARAAQ